LENEVLTNGKKRFAFMPDNKKKTIVPALTLFIDKKLLRGHRAVSHFG
jgi:hypothetical protein